MLPKDPVMLLSVIRYASLDALCEDMDADKTQIIAALGEIGYEYSKETNQFI